MSSLIVDFNEAESYEQISLLEREDGLKLINIVAPKGGSKVLDIGCGTGYHSKVIADLVGAEGSVVGIDPDTERLRLAKEKYSANNIEYLEGSAEDLPGCGYDLVFSNHVLHWCNDIDMVFRQVASKLKTGGIFAFMCITQQSARPDILSDELRRAFTFSTINEEIVKNLALSCNFSQKMMEFHEYKQVFENVHDVIKFIMTHSHGKFDETHFNIPALMKLFENGKLVFKDPIMTCILSKDT